MKSTVSSRSSVIVVAEATMSNLPWARSRKIVSNEVSLNSGVRPIFSAIASTSSMSKPLNSVLVLPNSSKGG